jgi:hypothetical protein
MSDEETAWVRHHLQALRPSENSNPHTGIALSLPELRSVYLGARVIQGGIIASHLALPAVVEAGETVRAAQFPDGLDHYAAPAVAQTELFLSGAHDGRPRPGNDYPKVVKRYIAAIAGLLNEPYEKSFRRLQQVRPDLWNSALDADELQRLCWGHMRWKVDEVISAQEMAHYRSQPLQEGTDALLALIKERTGVSLPARVMQRDSQDYVDPRADWLAALRDARQDPRLALLSGIRFSVENAEIATLYGLGSMLMRIHHADSTGGVLAQQICFGVQDIGGGTHMLTHNARFQSRLGARPNYYRSFAQFLRNTRKQIDMSPVQADGRIDWADTHAPLKRGWCPSQNHFSGEHPGPLSGPARDGRDALAAWQRYGLQHFGVTPEFSEPTAGELLAAVVLFTLLHEDSPLRPATPFMNNIAGAA